MGDQEQFQPGGGCGRRGERGSAAASEHREEDKPHEHDRSHVEVEVGLRIKLEFYSCLNSELLIYI